MCFLRFVYTNAMLAIPETVFFCAFMLKIFLSEKIIAELELYYILKNNYAEIEIGRLDDLETPGID